MNRSTTFDRRISVIALGMVSSLGHDVITCCAAARAGISRAQEIDYFPVVTPDTGAKESLCGHPIPELTMGFQGFGRLTQATCAGLVDLLRQAGNIRWADKRTGFYLSLADSRRTFSCSELVGNDDIRSEMLSEFQDTSSDDELPQRLFSAATRLANWPGEPELRFAARSGNTGVAEAMLSAAEELIAGSVNYAIVGGIDSLLDEPTLVWLENTQRLKTLVTPVGVSPGEAAAFIVLERSDHAAARGASPACMLSFIGMDDDDAPLSAGNPPHGRGLSRLLPSAANEAGWIDGQSIWLITDQNGETYRALEWGHAIVKLVSQLPAFGSSELWYPAIAFGDTGAASGAVAACVAARAFARGYAASASAAIVSTSEAGEKSVFLLSRN